jgi:hypothetical protein
MQAALKFVHLGATLVAVLTLGGCRSCVESQAAPITVDGPETPAMSTGLKGHLLYTVVGGHLMVTDLPQRTERTLRKGDSGATHSVAGPDRQGRVVLVVDPGGNQGKQHALKAMAVDGTNERTLFTRPGDALWDHVTGNSIALAPKGGNVAVLSATEGVQVNGALLDTGKLELWNLDTGKGEPLGLSVADYGLAFFPEGDKLAYVALEPKAEAVTRLGGTEALGTYWAQWTKIPVVHVRNLLTKADEALGVGEYPVVSSDGSYVLLSDGAGSLRRIDVASKSQAVLQLPGYMGQGPVGAVGSNVLYHARATTGAAAKTRPMSMGGQETLHTIKLGSSTSRDFVTLAESVGIHSRVSFGLSP